MEKTIKYLENGEYHYATVRSVGDLAQLQTDSKETLVEAINELWNGGGNVDPSKVPKPEGYDQLVQDIADVVKNQQEIRRQWIEWQNEEAQLTEERKQVYLQAMKEMQGSIDKAKADAEALNDKTAKLDEQITKTFSDLDTSIQNMHEQLQKEADRMDQDLQDTKGTLSTLRTDLQNTQMDNGRIHDELTNINGKFEHKVWQTDLDPLKEQIDRAETSVQQTKDELLGKASRQDLDTVTNTVSKLDTQLKENAKGIEISVKKDELGGEIAEALTDKTNILLGTRRFTTNNWTQRDHVEICSDPWKGFLVAKQNSPIEGIQQAYDVKAGTTYTFSLFAKMDTLDDSNKPQIILAKNNLDTSLDTKIDVWRKEIDDITSDFKRYDLTFTPSEDCTIYPHVISNSNNPIFVCGYQLEIGKTSTPWEPNQEDVGDYVEKSEAQFNVYNDKIQALTEKQRQQGDTQEKLKTEVTQTAEGTRQISENLKKTNDDITKLRGEFEVKADHMKSEYESYTNKAVGQISDSTLNLIKNSSFQNKDEDFAQWQNVSAKANVRSDENGLRWVELTQSGMTTDNIIGLTSNYFNIKQGKVTVAVDIKSGTKADLDIESVLTLELYDENKKRVDFTRLTLNDLGLNKSLLGDHQVHRGLYRLGIDRNDAKYMTVKALLTRNGDLYFTNFSARLSSIDDGAYEPNPDDLNQQILKQNTKIEQNAKEVAIKANSVDVTRDIKSAVQNSNGGGVNLLRGTSPEWKTLTGGGWFTQTTSTGTIEIGSLVPGDTVTYTITVRNNSQYAVYPEIIGYSDDPGTRTFGVKKDEGVQPGETKTVSMSAAIAENTINIDAWVATNDPSAPTFSVDAKNEKLEKGSVATPWTPAYEDTSAEIKSAKDAAIKVASDKIEIKANELKTTYEETLKTKINEVKTASEKFTSDGIEQTVKKIIDVKNQVDGVNSKVDNLQIGGRNYIKNSESITMYPNGTDNYDLVWSVYNNAFSANTYCHGNNKTRFSFYLTPSKALSTARTYRIYWRQEPWTSFGTITVPANTTDTQYYELTMTTPTSQPIGSQIFIRFMSQDTSDVSYTITKSMLTIGDSFPDWQPAPEDTDSTIEAVSSKIDQTATSITSTIDSTKQDLQGQITQTANDINGKVSGVEDKVNGLKIGGRNLLLDTGRSFTGVGTNCINGDFNNQGGYYYLAGSKKLSDLYNQYGPSGYLTISFDWVASGDSISGQFYPQWYGEPWDDLANSNYVQISSTNKSGHYKSTVQLTRDNYSTSTTYTIRFRQDNLQGNVTISNVKLEVGNVATDWTPAPEDINKKIDTQVLDSANINDMKTQGHYFVKSLTGNPLTGWVYVDVMGFDGRIRQDVYQDNGGKHMCRRLFGNSWSGWEQGAYISDVNNVKTEVTATVKNLGDRVTTQVNSVETKVTNVNDKVDNLSIGGRNLLKGTRDFNSKYWYQYGDSTFLEDNPVDSSVKEIHSYGDWASFRYKQTIQLDPNKNYMISADIAIYDGDGNGLYVTPYGVVDGQGASLVSADVNLAGFPKQANGEGFRRIYLPMTQHGRTLTDFRIEGHGDWNAGSGSVFISKIALYEGNTKMAWSDASDDFVEAIKEVNTKWDVANGQIQGKVTATDVNNIINGKGYATQSWAQTMFQMKSDSITLQAVRDNITNGIQNQVNGIQGKLEGDLSNICRNPTFSHGMDGWNSSHLAVEGPWSEMPTPKNGTLFVRDAYYGDYFPVSKGERYYTSVFAHNADSATFVLGLCFQLKDGNLSWLSGSNVPGGQTGKFDGYVDVPDNAVSAKIWVSIQKYDNFSWVRFTNVVVKKNDAISQINLSPDQIKIASNKIVIDGNTRIHGTLSVPEVRLQGKSGMIGLDGNKGIIISSAETLFQTRVTKLGMDFLTTTNGQKEIIGGITTGFSTNNGNLNGISIVLDTQQKLGYPYGGDFFSIGNTTSIVNDDNRSWSRAMDYDASGQLHEGGFMWYEKSYLTGEGQNIYVGGVRGNGNSAYDPLMIGTTKFSASAQPDKYQPVISLGYAGGNVSKAGIGFLWDQMKPYGNWDITDVGDIWYDGQKFRFGWYTHPRMMGNSKVPCMVRLDEKGGVMSGFGFAAGSAWAIGTWVSNITAALTADRGW